MSPFKKSTDSRDFLKMLLLTFFGGSVGVGGGGNVHFYGFSALANAKKIFLKLVQ